jgi:hypothetical protein
MQSGAYEEEASSGNGRTLPPAVIRKINTKSSEGGRGYCDFCRTYFCMGYIKSVKVSAFVTGLACSDCVKLQKLQVLYS